MLLQKENRIKTSQISNFLAGLCKFMKNKYDFYLFVGIISLMLQLVDQVLNRYVIDFAYTGFSFISFVVWGLFSTLSEEKQNFPYVLTNFTIGLLFSMMMVLTADALAFLNLFSVPVMALIVVPFMMAGERFPNIMNNVPMYFISAGIFFSLYSSSNSMNMLQIFCLISVYTSFGVLCGGITKTYLTKRKGV